VGPCQMTTVTVVLVETVGPFQMTSSGGNCERCFSFCQCVLETVRGA
jgi:hypothetical protein